MITRVLLSIGAAAALTTASVELATKDTNISLKVSGDASLQEGQVIKYLYKDYHEYRDQWMQQSFMHLGMDMSYKAIEINVNLEGRLWYSTPDQSSKSTGQAYALYDKVFSYDINEAKGIYRFGDSASRNASITAGLFRYKYNPEVRNLGEYLFRTYTYPGIIVNYFDLADARLAGFKFSGNLPLGEHIKLHGDLMMTFETERYPFFDATPSFIGNCLIGKFLDVGVGVSLTRQFPVNDSLTTPSTDLKNRYITANNDTGFYTYAGTKLMARLTFDPKRFIPLGCFGPEDLKIYSEATILGLENYPRNDSLTSAPTIKNNIWGYDTLLQKIPVVMGFNFPGFKVLDLISCEFEWYGCKYPSNLANAVRLGGYYAYPIPAEYNKPLSFYTSDDWKWSVYIKKTFVNNHVGIILQFARDHLRFQHLLDEPKVYEEALVRPNHWWWTSKIFWAF